ncbi:MAG: hypothetical protein GY810_12710 [Aureispira sp.]|nr:hypothetical protein [Aureispira sp.]
MDELKVETIWAFIILLMAAYQPLHFYYTCGSFMGELMEAFYMLIGFLGSITWVIYMLLRKYWNNWIWVPAIIGILGVSLGIMTGFMHEKTLEEYEWKWRLAERQAIIYELEHGKWEQEGGYIQLGKARYPLSNGGNEILVERKDGYLTATFFIDRGFYDAYAAYIYTTDPSLTARFEKELQGDYYNWQRRKVTKHWYRMLVGN